MLSSEIAAYSPANTDADTTVSSRVLERIAASVPGSTRRAYAGDWKNFAAWCTASGRGALPTTAETLAEYVSAMADDGKAPASIMRAISSIRVAHKLSGYYPPDTLAARAVVKTYRNERADQGEANERPAAALSVRQLKVIAESLDASEEIQLRDRLIFVLGWAMMARRGELVRLNIADVTEVDQGLDITVRKAKADQMAVGRKAAVPYGSDPLTCPVRLMRAWLAVLAEHGITSGPLFRRIDRHGHVGGDPAAEVAGRGSSDGRLDGASIRLIVRRAALRAGLPDDGIKAHSLRAGGATGAYLGGADLLSIGRHGGWHDGSAVLTRYIRDVDRWKKNPMHGAGL
jgi:site-specific recombinase XerD